MGFRDMIHQLADTHLNKGGNSRDVQEEPGEYQTENYDADDQGVQEGEDDDDQAQYDGNDNYESQAQYGDDQGGYADDAQEGDEEAGEAQDGDEEVDDSQIAGTITEIQQEEDDESQIPFFAADAGEASDSEEAQKSHNTDITIRTGNNDGDEFELKGRMDTGADANCISQDVVDMYNLKMIDEDPGYSQTFSTGSGDKVAPAGQVLLKFFAGSDSTAHTEHFHVIPGLNEQILMGSPFINSSGAVKMKKKFKDTPEQAEERAYESDPGPEVDLMAVQPPTKKEAAEDKEFANNVKQLQAAGGRKGRPAPR